MKLDEYQAEAYKTALELARNSIQYPAMGLAGEAGEVIEKVKKLWRDKAVVMPQDVLPGDGKEIVRELGDVLWYVSVLAFNLGYTLEEVAQMNLNKLKDRDDRGVIQGDGDSR